MFCYNIQLNFRLRIIIQGWINGKIKDQKVFLKFLKHSRIRIKQVKGKGGI